jgi:YD repeat-containing protein
VERDRDGVMKRIVSPHGHALELTTDAAGRIIRAAFGEHWMNYSYSESGHLSSTLNSKGARQQFTYDAAGNMLSIRENGYIATNRFDESNRFSWQRVSDGQTFTARYRTNAKGKIVETDVRGPDGLVQYHFDGSGREVSEEFRPGSPWNWQLDYARDPQTNVLQSLLLTCGDSRQVFLPTSFDRFFANLGEAHKEYLTQMCWHTKPAPQKTPKATAPGSPIVNGD